MVLEVNSRIDKIGGNLVYHQEVFCFESNWSFFETAHGKGPADGIDAAVKRGV